MRLITTVIGVLVTAASLAACAAVAAPHPSGPPPQTGLDTSALAVPGPPSGSRAEAQALAGQLLSRLRLPAGAHRLPATPVPPSLNWPLLESPGQPNTLSEHQLFAVAQPFRALAALLAARVPAGMSWAGTSRSGLSGDPTALAVSYLARSVPAGIYLAQLVLTMAPATSGGSLLRADAEVIWYPPRTAAEYIDPARYHALTVAVTLDGSGMRTIHRVLTSRAVITRLADTLNGAHAEPVTYESCPFSFATYRLGFAVSAHSRPVIVVSAALVGCGSDGITVGGHAQPPLVDKGAVSVIVDEALGINPKPQILFSHYSCSNHRN